MQIQTETVPVDVTVFEVPAWIFAAMGLAAVSVLILIVLAFQLRKRRK